MFQAEQQIGAYTLVKQLGQSGFGEVWLAEHGTETLTSQVLVKLLLKGQVDDETIKVESERGKQVGEHPNILPLIEVNEYDGQLVIVSKYAPDGSLEELLKKNGGILPIKQAVNLTIEILNGLEFLHAQGIIHGNLKPANILFEGEVPRLTDFGISGAMMTAAEEIPFYTAPEAFDGKPNPLTDIWSMGVILYEMLTGKLPFPGTSSSELARTIANHDPDPLPTRMLPHLQQMVNKALAKQTEARNQTLSFGNSYCDFPAPPQPDVRYQTAKEMRDNLKRLALILNSPDLLLGAHPPDHFGTRFPEGLAAFRVNEKYGFIDENANVVVVPQYDSVQDFYDGAAIVKLKDKFGLIDKQGNVIADFKYDQMSRYSSDGLIFVKLDGQTGYLDKNGNSVISPQYESIDTFHDGLARIWVNGKIGFIDQDQNVVIAPQYDVVYAFSEGLAAVKINDKWGFIDKSGKIVIPPTYDSVDFFHDGLARIMVKGIFKSKYGFIDQSGQLVVPPKYNEAYAFSEGLAAVKLSRLFGGKWGFIDQSGKLVIAHKYDSADSFHEGQAIVSFKGKYGLIDKNDHVFIDFKYDRIRPPQFSPLEDTLEVTLNGQTKLIFLDSEREKRRRSD